MLPGKINRKLVSVVKGSSEQHTADHCAFGAHELHISPGPNMKVSICILFLLAAQSVILSLSFFFFFLSFFGSLGRVHLTKEVEIKPPFESLLISRHHLLDWFGIVKSESFSMDSASEKPLPSQWDQSSWGQMICAVFKTALRACRRDWTAWTRSEALEEVMDSISPEVRWMKCEAMEACCLMKGSEEKELWTRLGE